MPKIVQLETFSNEFVCFVKVTSEDGYSGWGQTAPYNADITAQIFHRQVAPWALGHDCQDIPCLLYTSPSPRDQRGSRMPSSA